MAVVYQREAFVDVFDELGPLLESHYLEIAHYQDIPLDVDVEAYAAVDRVGFLRIFTARDDGAIIGYCAFVVKNSLHYRGSKQASQDVLYLDPDYRGLEHGSGLIEFCDEQLRAEGVQVVYQHVKHKHDFGPLLKYLGYEPIETIYGRRLDDGG